MNGMKRNILFLLFLCGTTSFSLDAKVNVLNFQETCTLLGTIALCNVLVSYSTRSVLKTLEKIPQAAQNFSYAVNIPCVIGLGMLAYGAYNKSDFFDDKLKNNEWQLQFIKIGSIINSTAIVADLIWQTMQKHGN